MISEDIIELMSSKEVLVNEILKEFDEIPIIYLKTLYAVIHSFKETLPVPEKIIEEQNEFDWDGLLEEIYYNRKQNNLFINKKAENLL